MSPDCHSMVVVAKLIKYRHGKTHIDISQYRVIAKIIVELSSYPIVRIYHPNEFRRPKHREVSLPQHYPPPYEQCPRRVVKIVCVRLCGHEICLQ
jgi:hypothetical protein